MIKLYSDDFIKKYGTPDEIKVLYGVFLGVFIAATAIFIYFAIVKYGDQSVLDLPPFIFYGMILSFLISAIFAVFLDRPSMSRLKLIQQEQIEKYHKIQTRDNYRYSVYLEDDLKGSYKVILCNNFTSYPDGSVIIHSESKDFVFADSEKLYYHHINEINENDSEKTLTAEEISKFQPYQEDK